MLFLAHSEARSFARPRWSPWLRSWEINGCFFFNILMFQFRTLDICNHWVCHNDIQLIVGFLGGVPTKFIQWLYEPSWVGTILYKFYLSSVRTLYELKCPLYELLYEHCMNMHEQMQDRYIFLWFALPTQLELCSHKIWRCKFRCFFYIWKKDLDFQLFILILPSIGHS